MDLHQGDCIQLLSSEELFQVIGIDDDHNRCWVRRWPLLANGSPVFEVSKKQITLSCKGNKQQPLTRL
ncbi:MAG TPA: hypothetical protein ACN46P_07605 [Prochlorococcus sp.]|jgi:hypothetical protein|nr:hypothetical protein [Prochlorococcaceae cyanobacterium ETNP18_MAG_17]MDP6322000.1 hypothetical protein [Prochlorococcaceae cyanobacterium ETNP14_MAG_5]